MELNWNNKKDRHARYGPRRSDPRRRRRRRACPKNWHFAAVGFQLVAHSRRARGRRSKRRPASIAASCVPISTASGIRMPATSTRSMPRAPRNTRCSPRCSRARPTRRCSIGSPTLRGDATPLGVAHAALAEAASRTTAERVEREYFDLFIGLGRGELLPYGSYYLTGSCTSGRWRGCASDLARLGIERAEGQCRAGGSRGDPVRDHGRADRRTASGAEPAPTASCSRSISRPGSAVSSPTWSEPRRPISTAMSARSAACSWRSRRRLSRCRHERRAEARTEGGTAMKQERKTSGLGRREFLRRLASAPQRRRPAAPLVGRGAPPTPRTTTRSARRATSRTRRT